MAFVFNIIYSNAINKKKQEKVRLFWSLVTFYLVDDITLIWSLQDNSRPLPTVSLNYATSSSSIHYLPPPLTPSRHSPDDMLGQKGSLPSVSLPYTTLSDGILSTPRPSYLAQRPTVMLRSQLHSLNHSTHNSSRHLGKHQGVRPISAYEIKNLFVPCTYKR